MTISYVANIAPPHSGTAVNAVTKYYDTEEARRIGVKEILMTWAIKGLTTATVYYGVIERKQVFNLDWVPEDTTPEEKTSAVEL